ncbi:MAG TPA: hypothetical protein VKQ27_12355 [Acetobacteraceae bacterium]|nr:hypothetical protein [Acetobacteraceae bacterium]
MRRLDWQTGRPDNLARVGLKALGQPLQPAAQEQIALFDEDI